MWQIERVQEAPAALLAEKREADGRDGECQPQERGVESNDADISWPAAPAAELSWPARRQLFPQRERGEQSDKADQADDGFAGHGPSQTAVAARGARRARRPSQKRARAAKP